MKILLINPPVFRDDTLGSKVFLDDPTLERVIVRNLYLLLKRFYSCFKKLDIINKYLKTFKVGRINENK